MKSRNGGYDAQESWIGDRAGIIECQEIGSEQDGRGDRRDDEEHQDCRSGSKCPQKNGGGNSKNQEIGVIEGLNFMAEHKKAEPDIIDKANVIAPTAPDGFLRIERPSEFRRLVDCRVYQCGIT